MKEDEDGWNSFWVSLLLSVWENVVTYERGEGLTILIPCPSKEAVGEKGSSEGLIKWTMLVKREDNSEAVISSSSVSSLASPSFFPFTGPSSAEKLVEGGDIFGVASVGGDREVIGTEAKRERGDGVGWGVEAFALVAYCLSKGFEWFWENRWSPSMCWRGGIEGTIVEGGGAAVQKGEVFLLIGGREVHLCLFLLVVDLNCVEEETFRGLEGVSIIVGRGEGGASVGGDGTPRLGQDALGGLFGDLEIDEEEEGGGEDIGLGGLGVALLDIGGEAPGDLSFDDPDKGMALIVACSITELKLNSDDKYAL